MSLCEYRAQAVLLNDRATISLAHIVALLSADNYKKFQHQKCMVLIYNENIHSSNRFWENQNYYTINMDYILNKIEMVDLFNAYGWTDMSHMTKRF